MSMTVMRAQANHIRRVRSRGSREIYCTPLGEAWGSNDNVYPAQVLTYPTRPDITKPQNSSCCSKVGSTQRILQIQEPMWKYNGLSASGRMP
jgi:hypothetical protein